MSDNKTDTLDPTQPGPLKLRDSFTFVVSRAGSAVNVCAVMSDPESNSVIPETGEKALRMAAMILSAIGQSVANGSLELVGAVINGHRYPPLNVPQEGDANAKPH